jgi:HSP20 family molecular chaperone IbpA
MSQIAVKAVTSSNEALVRLTQFRKAIHDEICEKAFRVFEQKGRQTSNELEDWVEAEHAVLYYPPSELAETNDEIRIRAAVPGFSSRTMQVYVLPNSITVQGQMDTTAPSNAAKVHFSELTEKKLLRQFDLRAPIDPKRVKATLGRRRSPDLCQEGGCYGFADRRGAEDGRPGRGLRPCAARSRSILHIPGRRIAARTAAGSRCPLPVILGRRVPSARARSRHLRRGRLLFEECQDSLIDHRRLCKRQIVTGTGNNLGGDVGGHSFQVRTAFRRNRSPHVRLRGITPGSRTAPLGIGPHFRNRNLTRLKTPHVCE